MKLTEIESEKFFEYLKDLNTVNWPFDIMVLSALLSATIYGQERHFFVVSIAYSYNSGNPYLYSGEKEKMYSLFTKEQLERLAVEEMIRLL